MTMKKYDPKQLTCDQIAMFLKDEREANIEYNTLGLKEMAQDEANHAKLLEKWQKQKGCQK